MGEPTRHNETKKLTIDHRDLYFRFLVSWLLDLSFDFLSLSEFATRGLAVPDQFYVASTTGSLMS